MKIALLVMSSLVVCACDDGGSDHLPPEHLDGGNGSGDGGGSGITCSTTMDLPAGTPYTDYNVAASQVFSGTATAYAWTVSSDSPCDAVIKANDGKPYSPTGDTTANLTFRPTLPGDYTVALKATTASGMVTACGTIKVTAPGLRVELCSDGTTQTDVDLHVHQPGSTANWFDTAADCFYSNCINQGQRVNWGYANSALASCSGSPNGSSYTSRGNCPNPRMDSDTLDYREFENINVDNAPDNMPIRVMAHFYAGSGTAIHPVVAIYSRRQAQGDIRHRARPGPGFQHARRSQRGNHVARRRRDDDQRRHRLHGRTASSTGDDHRVLRHHEQLGLLASVVVVDSGAGPTPAPCGSACAPRRDSRESKSRRKSSRLSPGCNARGCRCNRRSRCTLACW